MNILVICVVLAVLSTGLSAGAQETASDTSAPVASASFSVPRLIRFSGVAKDAKGKPLTGTIGITFFLYKDQQGGVPLWVETQNLQPDSSGRYTVLLGSTKSAGLPAELFASGEAQWLGVQLPGEGEQARVLMLSVPYALKALDAETVGGKPASAFALVQPTQGSSASSSGSGASIQSTPRSAPPPISGSGTTGHIAKWASSTKLGNSVLFQDNSGNVGVGITHPRRPLDVGKEIVATNRLTLAQDLSTTSKTWHLDNSNSLFRLFWQPNINTAGTVVLSANTLGLVGIGNALTLQGNVTDPCNFNTSANVIGGFTANGITAGVTGATIGGGGMTGAGRNLVTDDYGTVGGGAQNTAGDISGTTCDAQFATVGGGFFNSASKFAATVGGGVSNHATNSGSVVSGGNSNNASGLAATVSGGITNNASGYNATVSGGFNNNASGGYATVPGGASNSASGVNSFAAGQNATAAADGSFVWCAAGGSNCGSIGTNSFVVAVNGPIFFYDGNGTGCNLSAGGGSWNCSSDRNLKDAIVPIDSRSVLERVAQLPITQWKMKGEPAGRKHIGPMAQDFYAAFGLGDSDRTIALGDGQGVALAAIQALYEVVQDKETQIQSLKQQLRDLRQSQNRELTKLEDRLTQIEAQVRVTRTRFLDGDARVASLGLGH